MGSVNQQAILSQDPLALVIGMDLVSRAGLRLLPPTAGLGDALEGDWGLVGAKWIGSQCLIAATWRPDPALSAESVEKQLQARAKQLSDWLTQRAAAQRAKGTRGLLVVLGGAQPARLAQLQLPPGIGVISVGEQGGVQATGALGRVKWKIEVSNPLMDEYVVIWKRVCEEFDIPFSRPAIDRLVQVYYREKERDLHGAHPRDLAVHLIHIAKYQEVEPELSDELLDSACATYFVDAVPEVEEEPAT